MKPALRTCVTSEARQSSLSLKLARAANLLCTRVDVELEQQNQELLKSMNARTRLQLRLQTTVEGLSVAAITYYVVGLFGYLLKAAHDNGRMTIEPSIITAAFANVLAIIAAFHAAAALIHHWGLPDRMLVRMLPLNWRSQQRS